MPAARPLLSRFTLCRLVLALMLMEAWSGCLVVGGGLTSRQWLAGWDGLTADLSPEAVTARLGAPREVTSPGEDAPGIDEVWLYTRPEVTGTRTVHEGEHDIRLPNGRIISVPDYVDKDVRVIAEYRLYWTAEKLVRWERTVDD